MQLAHDERLRLAALAHAARLREAFDDHVPARELVRGFDFEGQRVQLVGPGMGIFKPKQLGDGPLSIRSSLASRYSDEPTADGASLRYDFAPRAREYDNDGLKRLCKLGRPLIYLIQVAPKRLGSEYAIVAPVYVVDWTESARRFEIALRPSSAEASREGLVSEISPSPIERAYRHAELAVRLHQAHFRRAVLAAYRQRCAVCELAIRPLLDAAHILPDAAGGEPRVENGLGLCVLHHRAFDRDLLRVTPEYTIRIDANVAGTGDAFAREALIAFEGRRLTVPREERLRPSPEALARRVGA